MRENGNEKETCEEETCEEKSCKETCKESGEEKEVRETEENVRPGAFGK